MRTVFEKDLKLWVLYDRYGALLSPKKREAFEAYYGEDLSLAEIAEDTGTTRQAVQDLLRRTCQELRQFEEKLNLLRSREENLALIDQIGSCADPARRAKLLAALKENL